MTDYHQILSRALASLEPNTPQARAQLFARARQMVVDRIRDDDSRWSDAEAEAELASFDAATDRIESDIARRASNDFTSRLARQPHTATPPAAEYDVAEPSKRRRMAVWGSVAVLCVLLIAGLVYAFRGGPVTATKSGTAVAAKPETAKDKVAARPSLDTDDLEPGVDGGSTDAALPYFLRRQMVYYRSVYSDGMIVVDRSQRFLYLLLPQSRALRYGIGVGGECSVSAGLYRIQNASQWPEWSPSPALLKRRSYPAKFPGGPGNPLGAYAMFFEGNYPGIHGTNAPRTIGQAPSIGCFRLVNDDVVDLAKRVAVGTAVVVLN